MGNPDPPYGRLTVRFMAVTSTTLVRVIGAMTLVLVGCQDRASSETESDSTTGTASGSSTTNVLPPGSSSSGTPDTAEDSSTTEPFNTEESDTQDSDGAQCDIYGQDCGDGDKCTVYSQNADLVPDDLRCCPITGNQPRQKGDSCVVQDYFGSCLDNCDVGTFCLDIDDDGNGVCQSFCGGSANNPECENDETCFIYFAGTPMCFDICDPLAQDCPEGQGCYPDMNAAGGTGFICLPQIGPNNTYNDYCWLLSNCAPGFICVTPDFLPNCEPTSVGVAAGCCTALCDVAEPDNCSSFDDELGCTSWYLNGQTPPSVSLEDVGVCILPP